MSGVLVPKLVAWSRLPRGPKGWACPHCNDHFITGKGHYHNHHARAQCVPAPGAAESTDSEAHDFAFEAEDSDPDQPQDDTAPFTIAAAVAAEQHDAAADLQQACILAGLSEEQQQLVFSALEDYEAHINGFIQSHVEQEAEQEEEEEDAGAVPKSATTAAAVKQQIAALKRAAEEPLYHEAGTAKISCLEANMELFAWRNEYAIKVSEAGPRACTQNHTSTHCVPFSVLPLQPLPKVLTSSASDYGDS